MTLEQIRKILDAQVVAGNQWLGQIQIEKAGAADLMSDVLAYSHTGALLLTGLASAQSLQTADIAEMRAIIYVRGKHPDAETVRKAQDRGIPLLCTNLGMFECCGRLFRAGIKDDGNAPSR